MKRGLKHKVGKEIRNNPWSVSLSTICNHLLIKCLSWVWGEILLWNFDSYMGLDISLSGWRLCILLGKSMRPLYGHEELVPLFSWDRMKQKYSCLVITSLRLWFSNEWLPGAGLHVMKVRPPFVPRDRKIYCCCFNLKKNEKKSISALKLCKS